jgi:hypothetical protein
VKILILYFPTIVRRKINALVVMAASALGYCFSGYITPYISRMSKSEAHYLCSIHMLACGTDREAAVLSKLKCPVF